MVRRRKSVLQNQLIVVSFVGIVCKRGEDLIFITLGAGFIYVFSVTGQKVPDKPTGVLFLRTLTPLPNRQTDMHELTYEHLLQACISLMYLEDDV